MTESLGQISQAVELGLVQMLVLPSFEQAAEAEVLADRASSRGRLGVCQNVRESLKATLGAAKRLVLGRDVDQSKPPKRHEEPAVTI
jgi:hypothetical protein